MDMIRAAELRHSVRDFKDDAIEGKILEQLNEKIDWLNEHDNVRAVLVLNDDTCFSGIKSKMGGFKNAKNYIVFIGPNTNADKELIGYYGEELLLYAQSIGLNSVWTAGSYGRISNEVELNDKEVIHIVAAIGYGKTQGQPHRSKLAAELSKTSLLSAPEWYKEGVRLACLAPTAMNSQSFIFELKKDNKVSLKSKGFESHVNKGILKYHFEIGAGKENFEWK